MVIPVYSLAHVLRKDFSFGYAPRIPKVDPLLDKLTFHSSGGQTHYGLTVFKRLDNLIPGVWEDVVGPVDLNNTNKNSSGIVWYLDGSKSFTEKHNLPKFSRFSIHNRLDDRFDSYNSHGESLMIQKPSHAYIGSGRFITIGRSMESLIKLRESNYQCGGKTYPIEHWVVQPLMQPALWSGSRKFDCRFFGVIFTIGPRVYATSLRYGIARLCVNPYSPLEDPLSAITNISIQETLPGYNQKINLLAIRDDLGIVEDMLEDLVQNTPLTITDKFHILILGFDIMFTPSGKPLLIEVNHEPHLEIVTNNAEKYCSMRVVSRLFGEIIPGMINDSDIPNDPDWSPIIVKTSTSHIDV